MSPYEPEDHERAAGGMDYDETAEADAAGATDWRRRLETDGPLALLEDVEEMIPQPVRAQVERFPLAAVCIGVGVGIFLGMKKSEPILAAVTSALTATAARNLGSNFEL